MHIKLTVDAEIKSLWEAVFTFKQTALKRCLHPTVNDEGIIFECSFFQEVTLEMTCDQTHHVSGAACKNYYI